MSMLHKTQADRSAETSGKILRAAQKLFAGKGFEGVTMRAIAAEAGVNLASIVYYFDNKEGLYLAVFRHYAAPLQATRMQLIEEADRQPSIRAYCRAFIEPAFHLFLDESLGGPDHARLLWRLPQEPEELIRKIHDEFYAPVMLVMREKIGALYEWTDESELSWRVHIMGSIFHSTLGKYAIHMDRLQLEMWMEDRDRVLERIVDTAELLLSRPGPDANRRSDLSQPGS